jgi:hypothetical protein
MIQTARYPGQTVLNIAVCQFGALFRISDFEFRIWPVARARIGGYADGRVIDVK